MLRFSCFLILHESQQMDFCLSGCAVHFSRRKAEISVSGRCLEAVLASSGQTQETAWGGAAGWAVPSPTPQLQAQTRQGGRALCCESLWAHQGMVQASHLYCVGCHLCWLPRQNFLSCWQSRTNNCRDRTPSSMKSSLRCLKTKLRFRLFRCCLTLWLFRRRYNLLFPILSYFYAKSVRICSPNLVLQSLGSLAEEQGEGCR